MPKSTTRPPPTMSIDADLGVSGAAEDRGERAAAHLVDRPESRSRSTNADRKVKL